MKMEDSMKNQKPIDFTKIDWEKVGPDKARFFYDEAIAHNRGIVENINNLNGKAFALLGIALAVLSACSGWLLNTIASGGGNTPAQSSLAAALLCATTGMCAVAVLLIVAVYPRFIEQSEGEPRLYFETSFYKWNFYPLLTSRIAGLQAAINRNRKTAHIRGRLIQTAVIGFAATPIAAITVFACLAVQN
jgi:hypothetical protein